MEILNESRGTVLAHAATQARRPLERMRGLLGRAGLEAGEALIIEPCSSIHTFFMRFPIDVAFLDAEGRVLRALCDLPPWRATRIYPRAKRVVELPAGTLAQTETYEGDLLTFAGLTPAQGAR